MTPERRPVAAELGLDPSNAVAVAGISRALIEAAPNLADIFALAARCIGTLIDSTVGVWSLSSDGAWLESRGVHWGDPSVGIRVRDATARHRQRAEFGALGTALATGAPVMCWSAELVVRAGIPDPKERDSFDRLVLDLGLDELMLLPVVSRGRSLGIIAVGRPVGAPRFSAVEQAMAREVADWTALALDNAMLVNHLDSELQAQHDDRPALHHQADLLEGLSDAVFSTDLHGVVRGWNDAAVRLYGYDADEMLGRRLYDVLPATVVESSESSREIAARLFREGRWEGEVHQRTADGRRLELLATTRLLTDSARRPAGFVTMVQDRTTVRRAMQTQEAFSRCVLDALPATTALLDGKGTIIAVNRAWKRFAIGGSGDLRSCGVGSNYLDVCRAALNRGDASVRPVVEGIEAVLAGVSRELRHEYPCATPDGMLWFVMHVVPVDDEDGGAVVSHYDVTWRKLAADELEHSASHDALTGLANRTLLTERLTEALDGLSADPTDRLGVLFIDVNRFKVINDSLGHDAGDRVLCAIADRISDCVGVDDTVARFGGDEFVVITRLGGRDDLTRLAERIRAVVGRRLDIEGRALVPAVGMGVVSAGAGSAATEVLADADDAMYQAKAHGPGQITFFDAQLRERVQSVLDTELALRDAIEHGRLVVEYQAVVGTTSRRIDSFEALVRWNHPTRGRISPDEFIPVAEETGLIVPLGAWVLDAAVATAGTWAGRESVAVNLSPIQLMSPGLVEMVEEIIDRHRFPAQRLVLEVTETGLMRDREAVTARLTRLRHLGIRIAIDDFGTGYSSFAYLRELPVDALKIDQSFVADLPGSAEPIVEAIVRLADALGLDVIAEGVEYPDQVAVLEAMGCPHVQGFLFARPVPAEGLDAVRSADRRDLDGPDLDRDAVHHRVP